MVALFHANILLMPCQICNQISWMKRRFWPIKVWKGERESRLKRTSEKQRKQKYRGKWENIVLLTCIMATFFSSTSHCSLSAKWLVHWIWIHVNFRHWLYVTSSKHASLISFQCTCFIPLKKIFAFLLCVAAYAFFFLTNVQNLYLTCT